MRVRDGPPLTERGVEPARTACTPIRAPYCRIERIRGDDARQLNPWRCCACRPGVYLFYWGSEGTIGNVMDI